MTATSSEHGGCCREFIDGKALETCVLWTSTVRKESQGRAPYCRNAARMAHLTNNYFEGAKK